MIRLLFCLKEFQISLNLEKKDKELMSPSKEPSPTHYTSDMETNYKVGQDNIEGKPEPL